MGDAVPVVLASASPRRRALLSRLGLDPVVRPADVDETARPGETPTSYVRRLARTKGTAIDAPPGSLVVAADTTVVHRGAILGKPADDADAAAMLAALAGESHEVVTGVWVGRDGAVADAVVTTRVWFRPLSSEEIASYVATGEGRDKAGAYGIQGGAGSFVTRIEGSDSNVVGLPLAEVVSLAARIGVVILPGGTITG